VSFDRNYDADDAEPAADHSPPAAHDFPHAKDAGKRAGPELAESPRDRAMGELAAENADLYRRNAAQDKMIQTLQARLDRSEARFHAWADRMAANSEAQAKREEALTDRVAELERALADRTTRTDPLGAQRRIDQPDRAGAESGQHERRRGIPSNEFVGIGMALGVEAVTAVADPTPSNLLIGAMGIVATGIPRIRKIREADDDDRPRG
jgi:hypothetical protein